MSKTIDERVVQMKFDNKDFERNAKTSMSTMEKLKEKLNFKGASTGLEKIGSAVNSINLGKLGNSADVISGKFSALQTIAIGSLLRIGAQIERTASRMVSAFTIDPIKSGFQEYETQMNAVQTILANTSKEGTNLKTVNAALDELNLYADKTIYNFTEMTRNIGTFTAAGVKLDDSVAAIKGIANLAAVSGSNAQQASTAMYQLSQAMAAGTVKLMDWNSVVNAGMGGQVFQDSLKETARVHGIAIDQMIEEEGSFRETLKEGWLTTEILTETLSKFTGDLSESQLKQMGYTDEQIKGILEMGQMANDAATKVKTFTQLIDTLKEAAQSGWSQTWRLIVGDFEEAKALFTTISNTLGGFIEKTSNARNTMLKVGLSNSSLGLSDWNSIVNKGYGGEKFINEIKAVAKEHDVAIDDMITKEGSFKDTLEEGWLNKDIFNEALKRYNKTTGDAAKSTEDLSDIIEKMNRKSGRVLIGEAFQNFGKIISQVSEIAGRAYQKIFNPLSAQEKGERLYGIIKSFNQWATSLKLTEKDAKNLKNTFEGLFSILHLLSNIVGGGLKIGFKILTSVLKAFDLNILDVTGAIGKYISKVDNWLTKNNLITKAVKFLIPALKEARSKLIDFADSVRNLPFVQKSIEFVTKAFESLRHSISNLTPEKAWNGIKNLVNAFKENKYIKSFTEALSSLGEVIKNVFTKNFSEAKQRISDFASGASKKIDECGLTFETFKTIIKDFYEKILTYFGNLSKIKKTFSDFCDSFKRPSNSASTNLSTFFGNIRSTIGTAIEWFKNTLSNFNLGKLLAIAFAVVYIKFIWNAANAISRLFVGIWKFTNNIAKVLNGFAKIEKSIARYINSQAAKAYSEVIFTLAKSMAVIAGSLFLLSKVPTEDLKNTAIILGTFFAAIAGISILLGKFGGGAKGQIGPAVYLISFAASLYIMVSAFKKVTDVIGGSSSAQILGALGVITVLLAEMIGVLALTSLITKKLGGGTLKQAGAQAISLISFAVALYLMTKSFESIAKLDPKQFKQGLIGISALLLEMVIVVGVLESINATKGTISSSAGTIKAFGFAITLMAISMKILGTMSISEIVKGLACITMFSMLCIALTVATSMAGPNAAKAGATILAMSAAFILMGLAVKILANINMADFKKGYAIMVAFGLLCTGLIAATKLAGSDAAKAGLSILLISAAFVSMAVAVFILGSIETEKLVKGTIVLAAFTLMVMGLIAVSKLSKKLNVKAILIVTACFAVLVGIMALLTLLDSDKVMVATGCMSALMLAMSVLMRVSTYAKRIKIGPLLGFVAIVAVLAGVIAALSLLNPQNVISSAVSLGVLLLALSASIAILSALGGKTASAMVGALVMGIILAELVIAFAILNKLDADKMLTMAIALSIALLSMVAAITVLTIIGGLSILALAGAAAMLALIAVIGLIGAAMENPAINKFITTGLDALVLIAEGIGRAVAVFLAAATSSLGVVASNLSAFMENLGPFLSGVSNIPDGTALKCAELAAAIIALTVADFVSAITKILTLGIAGDLGSLGLDLSLFMCNLMPFIIGLKMITPEMMECASSLAGVVIALTVAEFIDGIAKLLHLGEVQGLSEKMTAFAYAVVAYGAVMKSGKVDPTLIADTANAGKILVELAAALPRSGGWVQTILGEKDIGDFGLKIIAFARGMLTYSTLMTNGNVDSQVITETATAGKVLVELASALPKSGGWAQTILGAQDLAVFGEQISTFGQAMVDYSAVVSAEGAINVDAIQASKDAADILVQLEKSLPKLGVVQELMGSQDLGDFGERIKKFGQSMVEYSKTVSKDGAIDPEALEATSTAGMMLVELANAIPKTGGLGSLFTGDSGLDDFGANLMSFGYALKDYSTSISGVDIAALNLATTQVQRLVFLARDVSGVDFSSFGAFGTALYQLAGDGITKFIEAFTDGQSQVNSKIRTFATDTASTISNQRNKINTAITNVCSSATTKLINSIQQLKSKVVSEVGKVGTSVASSIKSTGGTCNSAITTVINNMITTIRGERWRFEDAGEYLVIGFANGIEDNTWRAEAKAKAMANAASRAAEKELEEKSPSKRGYRIGAYFPMGVANGIEAYTKDVANASTGMAQTAIGVMNDAVSKIADIPFDTLDMQPVIRPVLDLTDVEAKKGRLNAMFTRSQAMKVNSEINAASSVLNGQNGNLSSTGQTTYKFEQNNYSPKALTRSEIYRQTKNLLSTAERVRT